MSDKKDLIDSAKEDMNKIFHKEHKLLETVWKDFLSFIMLLPENRQLPEVTPELHNTFVTFKLQWQRSSGLTVLFISDEVSLRFYSDNNPNSVSLTDMALFENSGNHISSALLFYIPFKDVE